MSDEDRVFRALTKCQKAIRRLAHPYRVAVVVALQNDVQLGDANLNGKMVFRGNMGLSRSGQAAPGILEVCKDALDDVSEKREQVLSALRTLYIAPPVPISDEDYSILASGYDYRES